jgi:hypothetical protein
VDLERFPGAAGHRSISASASCFDSRWCPGGHVGVGLADRRHQLGITEDGERLLERLPNLASSRG